MGKTTIRPSALRTVVNLWSAGLVAATIASAWGYVRLAAEEKVNPLFGLVPIAFGAATYAYWAYVRFAQWEVDWDKGTLTLRKLFSRTEAESGTLPAEVMEAIEIDTNFLENLLAHSPLRFLAAGTLKVRKKGADTAYTIGPIRDPLRVVTKLQKSWSRAKGAKEAVEKKKGKKEKATTDKALAEEIGDAVAKALRQSAQEEEYQ